MRATLVIVVAAFIAGCATTPAPVTSGTTRVYDQKTNTYRHAATTTDKEFVGTSASGSANKAPSWYRFGHP